MRTKRNAFLVNFTHSFQAQNLKTAGVGQDWAIPFHKMVQAPKIGDQVCTGSQIKMIRVPQDQAGPQIVQISGGQGFDRGLRAHRRKNRRWNIAVGGVDDPGPGLAVFIFGEKFK